MALNIPNIAPASPMSDAYDVYKELKSSRNAFKDEELKQRMQEIKNQFLPDEKRADLESKKFSIDAARQKFPLEIEKMRMENQFYPDRMRSEIKAKEGLADWRGRGGMQMGVGQKELYGFQRQLMQDNPDWSEREANQAASAYLAGLDALPDGRELPPLSGLALTQRAQIQKRNSTAQVQNQATQMDVLADDLNAIDMAPVAKFAGLKGRYEYAKYAKDMALGRPVPQEFRDYLAFRDVTSNFAMDALRKGFGTSVVPEYVYATLGKAANPTSTFWYDPQQVIESMNQTKNWINRNAKSLKRKATQGVGVELKEKNSKKATLRYNPKTGDFEEIQ